VSAKRPSQPLLPEIDAGIGGLRVAVAGGYFQRGAGADVLAALERVARALGVKREIEIAQAARARAAAYLITATESASLHLDRLRCRAGDFDPTVRDRLLAGALVPAALVVRAQKFRRWYRQHVLQLFAEVDVILAPATPCTAPEIGQQTLTLDGKDVPLRANLGLYTQPISFIGLPVVAVPVPLTPLPVGVQLITAPWREDIGLRVARALERQKVVGAPRPPN
jgi:1-carboxybiuret hydrolase